ncbi:uncharacterized protein LOC141877637 [Acropora palmata]|uniref:uncharacterized protein LOC141877637 n=1 Tax=Acropora palmata TaxID=6131 RepID=UPI003DA11F5F
MASETRAPRRSRNLKKKFVLLRWCDRLRVPRTASMRSLEAAGRVKDIEFPNNSTTEHVRELLLNSFGNHLNAADVDRLHFYKTVASSNLLDLAGTAEEMHGQRLKTTFQNRSKVFMRLLLDSNGSVTAPQVDSGDAIVDTGIVS